MRATDKLAQVLEVTNNQELSWCRGHQIRPIVEKWRLAQSAAPGTYFQCGYCGAPIVIKRNPGGNGGHPAHCSNAVTEQKCPQRPGRRETDAIELSTLDDDFFDPCVDLRLDLRLRAAAKAFARNPTRLLSPDEGGPATERTRHGTRSIFGFLRLACEVAGLDRWWPTRPYARTFAQIIPHIAASMARPRVARAFADLSDKLVFPEAVPDFETAVDSASAAQSRSGCLASRALVIGRLFRAESCGGRIEVVLTGMRDNRLIVDGDLWNSARHSFGFANPPGKVPGLETLLIAVVSCVSASRYRVHSLAWACTDHEGMFSESHYETRFTEECKEMRLAFLKPILRQVRVGRWTMLPDYVIRISSDSDLCRWVITEVDPNGSADSKPSKRRRLARCKEADVTAISFDPKRNLSARLTFAPNGPVMPASR